MKTKRDICSTAAERNDTTGSLVELIPRNAIRRNTWKEQNGRNRRGNEEKEGKVAKMTEANDLSRETR